MREMKDSGIEWIGTIPFDWKCCKQKYEIQLINGRAYSDSEFEEDGKYRILRVGNLFSNPTWYTSSLELPPDKYCENGDLLYSWSMSYAPVIWTGEKVIYHYHIWKTKLSSNLNKKFAYYYLSALTDALKAKIHETTMGFITMGVMNNSYIAFPCLKEQEKIVSFLDSQCSEIDALSADIQKEIETLEQYKRSVITEAVTKGLNPDAEMKDSGAEWIGEVPTNWDLGRIGGFYSLRNEKVSDKDYPPLSVTMKGVLPQLETAAKTNDGDNRKLVRKGDFAINSRSDRRGSCGISKYDGSVSLINTVLTPRGKMSAAYYDWVFHCTRFSDEFYRQGHGIVDDLWTTGWQEMKKIIIPVPPLPEQNRIADYLSSKCSDVDFIISQKNQQVETLANYKKTLIYEYVTGKKEVPVQN